LGIGFLLFLGVSRSEWSNINPSVSNNIQQQSYVISADAITLTTYQHFDPYVVCKNPQHSRASVGRKEVSQHIFFDGSSYCCISYDCYNPREHLHSTIVDPHIYIHSAYGVTSLASLHCIEST
jgi:hypothetical protein